MSRFLRLTLAMSAAAVAATALAGPAFAVDPTPSQNAMLLQASDLPASYGKPSDSSFTNVQGGGALASACTTANGQNPGTSIPDKANLFSTIDYSSGMTWSQSIYQYASVAEASKAFAQMVSKAVPQCNGSAVSTKGDDNSKIAPRTTVVSAKVKKGIIVATYKATTKGGGKPPYADSYTRLLTKLSGNAIESLNLISSKPISVKQQALQDATFAKLLARYTG